MARGHHDDEWVWHGASPSHGPPTGSSALERAVCGRLGW